MLSLLLGTGKLVVDTIAAHTILGLTNRYDVDALARLQRDLPVVLRYTCHDVVARQGPALSDMAVLYPYIPILFGEAAVGLGILCENRGMRLAVVVHDVPLVVHDILNGHRRRNHLARSTEVVKLASLQGDDGYGQLAELGVVNQGIRT